MSTFITAGTIGYANNSKFFRTQDGYSIVIYNNSNYVYYRVSSDNGVTWGNGISLSNGALYFDAVMDASGNIWVAGVFTSSGGARCNTMTYNGSGSWSNSVSVVHSSGNFNDACIALQSNGNIHIVYRYGSSMYFYYSVNGGSTWGRHIVSSFLSDPRPYNLIPYGTNMMFTVASATDSEYLISDGTDWSSSSHLTITTDVPLSSTYNISSSYKVSDTEIYYLLSTTSGLKSYLWNGSTWSTGVVIDTYAQTESVSLGMFDGKVTCLYKDNSTPDKLFYAFKSTGNTWDTPVQLSTDDLSDFLTPMIIDSSNNFYYIYQKTGSNIYFDELVLPSALNEPISVIDSIEVLGLRTNWYVSPTGSDTTGTGSQANPFKHIYYAFSQIEVGTATIHCEDGTYDEESSIHFGSKNITIKSVSGDFTKVIVKPLTIANSHGYGAFWYTDSTYGDTTLTVEDITILLKESFYTPVNTNGTYVFFRDLGSLDYWNVYVNRCFISGEKNGTYLQGIMRARVYEFHAYLHLNKTTIRNFDYLMRDGQEGAFTDCIFENITTLLSGTNVYSGDYNCFYNITTSGLTTNTHDITTDPQFTGDADDATISVLSDCVDAGVVISGIVDTYSGTAPDIGIFETVAVEIIDESDSLSITDEIEINVSQLKLDLFETIDLQDIEQINSAITLELEDSLSLSDGVTTNYAISLELEDSIDMDDTVKRSSLITIEINETITVDETVTMSNQGTVSYASKILSYNPLLIVTDTSPAKIIEVDVSIPATPTWDIYTLTGVSNANSITYNSLTGYIYVVCDSGELKKIHNSDLNTQILIDTLDTDDLEISDILSDEFKNFIGTSNLTGEIIMLDEASLKAVSTDIRFLRTVLTATSININTVLGKSISSDIRFLATVSKNIGVDIRFLKYDYSVVSDSPIDYTDWLVKINDVDMVPLNDIDMKSIIVNLTSDTKSSASFLLHRQHDKLNFTNAGTESTITSNNSVKIYIDGNLVFDGKVSNIDTASETESVMVNAQGDIPITKKNAISLPLPSVNEQLNLYHCLVDNVTIDNPYIDIDEENPEYYKGIKYDKGTMTKQQVSRYITMKSALDEINEGTFVSKQNWSYFWRASIHFLNTEGVLGAITRTSPLYIGTSLSPISSDVIELDGAWYSEQRIYTDIISPLGYGYVGEAPYKEISPPNGVLITKTRWEDREDGLYCVTDDSYDNRELLDSIAQLEYEKLQNINGDILPITSAEIHLSLNGYFYYDVNLLSRINLTNTTTPGIYSNLNGFPIAVKNIQLSSNNMKAVLTCDNQKSQEEMDAIDARYPDYDSGKKEGSDGKHWSKWDILERKYIN